MVAKLDWAARTLPAEDAAIFTVEQEEQKEWCVKQDEEHLKSLAQYELDTLPGRLQVICTGIDKVTGNAVVIRKRAREPLRRLTELGLMSRCAVHHQPPTAQALAQRQAVDGGRQRVRSRAIKVGIYVGIYIPTTTPSELSSLMPSVP